MASGKEIKSRIKSVKNTGKITKAMELISTVKMKKAQESVLALRPFALATLNILRNISEDEENFRAYTVAPESDRELIVMIAAQKGLCGGYNVNTFKKLVEYLRTDNDEPYTTEYDYVTIGKRAREFILRTERNLIADFSEEITDPARPEATRRLVRFLLDAWQSGKYAKISILYNQYVSAIAQLPLVKTIFPFQRSEITAFLARIVADTEGDSVPVQYSTGNMMIEPSPALVFEYAIPMILDAIVHETVLEAHASEHAARMVAMKNAKDAAGKKAKSLTLAYNKARQSAITTEITEIVSGVESMKD